MPAAIQFVGAQVPGGAAITGVEAGDLVVMLVTTGAYQGPQTSAANPTGPAGYVAYFPTITSVTTQLFTKMYTAGDPLDPPANNSNGDHQYAAVGVWRDAAIASAAYIAPTSPTQDYEGGALATAFPSVTVTKSTEWLAFLGAIWGASSSETIGGGATTRAPDAGTFGSTDGFVVGDTNGQALTPGTSSSTAYTDNNTAAFTLALTYNQPSRIVMVI